MKEEINKRRQKGGWERKERRKEGRKEGNK
jgi:hypothetical protein